MWKFIKANIEKAKHWWRWRNCREVRINAEDLRLPGETDEQLRARIFALVAHIAVPGTIRCIDEAGNEMANVGKLDELAYEDYNTTRLPGESDEELRHRLHEMVDNGRPT